MANKKELPLTQALKEPKDSKDKNHKEGKSIKDYSNPEKQDFKELKNSVKTTIS